MASIEKKVVYVATLDEKELQDVEYALNHDGRADTCDLASAFSDACSDNDVYMIADESIVGKKGAAVRV